MLSLGTQVEDIWGNKGIVVKINVPENPSDEDHGTIYVWQSDRLGYGDDNCEHYVYVGWERILKIM